MKHRADRQRFAAAAVLVVGTACACQTGPAANKTIKLGIELPQSGNELANGEPTANGIKLAVKQANDKKLIPGYTIEINSQDDAVNGVHNPDKGRANMQALASDAAVLGVVGPFNSNVARAEIPVSNEAGLVQCSPANTGVDLTQEGSEQYRAAGKPRNYFRLAAPDNIQGPGDGELRLHRSRQAHGVHHGRHRGLRRGRSELVRGRVQASRRNRRQARQRAEVDH